MGTREHIAKVLDVVKLQALYVVRKLGDLSVGSKLTLILSPLLPIYSFVLGSITGTVNVYTVRQVDRCQGH